MKKKNCNCEFADQRSSLLLRNFRESIARQSKISAVKAFKESVDAPAPRFWVSEARATRVIAMLLKGEDPTSGMHSEKRKMYLEIFRRVKELKESNPEMPLGDLVFSVVNSPAPCSYLQWQTAGKIIYAARRSMKNLLNQKP